MYTKWKFWKKRYEDVAFYPAMDALKKVKEPCDRK